MLFALWLDIKDSFIMRVAPTELYFPSVCMGKWGTYYTQAIVDCKQLQREDIKQFVSFMFLKYSSSKHPCQLEKNHLYLLARSLLVRVKMPRSMSVPKKGYGPYVAWELSEAVSLSQPDVSHSCLKLRERKRYVFLKKEGSSDHISRNIKQSVIVKSLYTACFSQIFLFLFEPHFLLSAVD